LIKNYSYEPTSRFEFQEPDWSAVLTWLRELTGKVGESEAEIAWREEILEANTLDDYLGKATVSVWLSDDLEDFLDVAAAFHRAYKYYRSRGSSDDPDSLFGDLMLAEFQPMMDWAGVTTGNQRNVGIAFASLGRYQPAIRCYKRSSDQENPRLWEYLGHMYHAIGDYEAEITAYENAFQRAPTQTIPVAYLTYATKRIIPSIDVLEHPKVF